MVLYDNQIKKKNNKKFNRARNLKNTKFDIISRFVYDSISEPCAVV